MIQRVQTIYMLLASALVGVMLFFPLVSLLGYELNIFGIYIDNPSSESVISFLYMGVLNVVAAAFPLLIMFLYKNRMLQIRLCYVTIVLMFGLQLFVGYYIYMLDSSIEGIDVSEPRYSATVLFPILGIIFMWLALRGIVKDESLIRSLDRIR